MQLVLALKVLPGSNPLRLNLVVFLEDALGSVKAIARANAAIVIPVHELPNMLLDVVEHRWVANPSDKTTTDEMIDQGVMPVKSCVASPVQADPQVPKDVGVCLWVLRR